MFGKTKQHEKAGPSASGSLQKEEEEEDLLSLPFKSKLARGEPIPVDLKLSAELLMELDVSDTKSNVVFTNLRDQDVETWAAFVGLVDAGEDEVKKQVGDLPSSGALVASFKEYNARKAAGLAPGAGGDVLSVRSTPQTDVVTRQLKRELDDKMISKRLKLTPDRAYMQDAAEAFIQLATPLFSSKRERIFVRDFMPGVVNRVISWLEDAKNQNHSLILGGNCGCGKSVIGFMTVIHLVTKGHIVIYEYFGALMLVIPPHDRVIPREMEALDLALKEGRISKMQDYGAFLVDSRRHSAFVQTLQGKHIIFIQDVSDTSPAIPSLIPGTARLIVTSPNAAKLRYVEKLPNYKTIVIPTWTEEEIMKLDAVVPCERVKSRFKRMGGIPRWVCDAEEGRSELRQDFQISNLSFASLRAMMADQSFASLPSQIDKSDDKKSTDLVIRIEPAENDDTRVQAVITSDYVAREVARRFVDEPEFSVQGFVSATSGISSLAHLRGYAVEAFAHRALTNEIDVKMQIQRLSDLGRAINDLPSKTGDLLHFRKRRVYDELKQETIERGVYFQPKRKNEPTIDSFAVVDQEFMKKYFPDDPQLEQKAITHFAIFFQVTVSATHVVDGTVLRRLLSMCKQSLKVTALGVVFVFLTTEGGINQMQVVTLKKGNKTRKPFEDQAQFGCQYAIRIQGAFADLAAKLLEHRKELEQDLQAEFDNNTDTESEAEEEE